MRKYFITYGDDKFNEAKNKIIEEANSIDWFDEITDYSDSDVSDDIRETGLMEISRGGGLWSWKPDIIYSHIKKLQDGDILIYADSGCTLNKSSEWNLIEKILEEKDIIAQKILQPTYKWTRKEIIDAFICNPTDWRKSPQHCATVIIIKITKFSRQFIEEWRQTIINNPNWIKDVSESNRSSQYEGFIENRHDQAIYSALIYKYLHTQKIHRQWERIENYDIIKKQAIRASRLRNGQTETVSDILKKILKRLIKAYCIYPLKSLMDRIV